MPDLWQLAAAFALKVGDRAGANFILEGGLEWAQSCGDTVWATRYRLDRAVHLLIENKTEAAWSELAVCRSLIAGPPQHLDELAPSRDSHPGFHEPPQSMNAVRKPPIIQRRRLIEHLGLLFQQRQIMQRVWLRTALRGVQPAL
jgi:hypothetical protein